MKLLRFAFVIMCICCLSTANAQSASSSMANDEIVKNPDIIRSNIRNYVRIPDIKGFYTMKCDFHTHTLFSDGSIWPSTRVTEAWQHGLDAVAITDHLEYRPNKNTLTGDHNESYKIAKKQGDELGILVVQGSEVTRNKPFGHMNALFITDANQLDIKDSIKALELAIQQGGFIQWNHPGWPDNKSTLYPVQEKLIKENKIHGIEVSNGSDYYPVSFDWCKKMNLAFMGNSDVHGLIAGSYKTLRPMTLVFTNERSVEGLKKALFAKRSVALFNGCLLAGPQEYLLALLEASLEVKLLNKNNRRATITNKSDIEYRIQDGEYLFILPPGKTIYVKLPSKDVVVLNCFTGLNENLKISVNDIENIAGLR